MASIHNKFVKKRKIFQFLLTLTKKELRDFHQFAQSPYQKLADSEIEILAVIIHSYPEFEITEKQLLDKVSKKVKINPDRLNFHLHQLFSTLEKWMIIYELEADELLQKKLLMRAHKRRFQHKGFFKQANETQCLIKEDLLDIPETWLETYFLNAELFYHVRTFKNQPKVDSLDTLEQQLDLFYHGIKIRLFCQRNVRSGYLNSSNQEKAYLPTLEFTKQQNVIVFFNLYQQLVEYRKAPKDEKLQEMIVDFKTNRMKFDRKEQAIFISLIINSLIPAINAGQKKYERLQFELLHYSFENDLVIFNNEIPATVLNNYLMYANMLGEFKISKSALKKYITYIHPEIRKDFENLLQCSWLYYKKEFEKAETQLGNHKFQDSILKLRSRNLLLKCFYERFQKDSNLKLTLKSELTNFKRFVSKQHYLTDARKLIYQNMVFVIRKLTSAQHNRRDIKRDTKEMLTKYLTNPSLKIMSKDWLLEKVESL